MVCPRLCLTSCSFCAGARPPHPLPPPPLRVQTCADRASPALRPCPRGPCRPRLSELTAPGILGVWGAQSLLRKTRVGSLPHIRDPWEARSRPRTSYGFGV